MKHRFRILVWTKKFLTEAEALSVYRIDSKLDIFPSLVWGYLYPLDDVAGICDVIREAVKEEASVR